MHHGLREMDAPAAYYTYFGPFIFLSIIGLHLTLPSSTPLCYRQLNSDRVLRTPRQNATNQDQTTAIVDLAIIAVLGAGYFHTVASGKGISSWIQSSIQSLYGQINTEITVFAKRDVDFCIQNYPLLSKFLFILITTISSSLRAAILNR